MMTKISSNNSNSVHNNSSHHKHLNLSCIISILLYAGDSDYDVVTEVFTFTPEEDSVQCLNISIIDNDHFENSEMFTMLLTVSEDYNSRILIDEPVTVTIL